REIVAGQNWRNLRVLVPVTVLALANIGFHLEAHAYSVPIFASHAGIWAMLILIMLIGGRLIPGFTHNWLVRENPGRLPIPFGRFDAISIAGRCPYRSSRALGRGAHHARPPGAGAAHRLRLCATRLCA